MQQINVKCKDCYYYTNGNCKVSLLDSKRVRPDDYCGYWMLDKTGKQYVAKSIILGIREEKK